MKYLQNKRRNKGQFGLSLVETLIAIGLGGIVLFAGSKTLNSIRGGSDWVLSYSDYSIVVDNLRSNIRSAYLYRTQIDPVTGAGLYDGVIYDEDQPNQFTILLRDSEDTEALTEVTYRTACANIKPGPMPPPWDSGCSNLPSCSGDQVLTIVETIKPSSGATVTRLIPPRRGKIDTFFRGAAFCVNTANNNKISLIVATANVDKTKQGDQEADTSEIMWRQENIEIWDDLGRQGAEFLR